MTRPTPLAPVPTVADLLADPQRVQNLTPEGAQMMLYQLTALLPALASRAATNGHALDRLLTAEEAASRLRCGVDHVYKHAKSYPFTVKNGGKLLFSEAGIDKWIREQQGRKGGR